MGLFDEIRKAKKRRTLLESRTRGKWGETAFAASAELRGQNPRRSPTGRDFIITEGNPITGKGRRNVSIEVKTGGARLSPLQKRYKKKIKNYRVVRY